MKRLYVAAAVRSYHRGVAAALPRGVLVEHGRIVDLVNPDDRLERRSLSGVKTCDLGGGVLVPGFVDAHNHQPTAARDVGTVRTARATSMSELQAILREAVTRTSPGSWIVTEHSLTVSQLGQLRLPSAKDLDAAVPHHPCAVRFGAHTMVLNTRGLVASGVAALAADPAGGVIDRDPATGTPTGPLHEYGALRLVLGRLDDLSDPRDSVGRMRLVQGEYASAGLTTVRVPGLRPGDLGVYQRLLEHDGRLANRVVAGPRIDPTASQAEKLAVINGREAVTGFGSRWLRLDAVKLFVDGGVETALSGEQHRFLGGRDLAELVGAAAARGWSVACHAVTQEAVDLALEAFAAVPASRQT
jgi:predicted amidohydrolase YtcJ